MQVIKLKGRQGPGKERTTYHAQNIPRYEKGVSPTGAPAVRIRIQIIGDRIGTSRISVGAAEYDEKKEDRWSGTK